MVKAPTPEEEDRRRLCRERKVLIAERVKHVNRVKGLLFSQGVSGYEPLRRDRRRRLDELRTGDGRPLPEHLKAQISRELDRLELLLEQIKEVEAERDALLAAQQIAAPAAGGDVARHSRASAPSSPPSSGRKGYSDTSTIAARSLLTRAWRRHPGKADRSIANRACPKQAIRDCEPRLIQLAWLWLRHQPQSALTLWFKERVKRNGGRLKKSTIVALARKLLVALWKYVTAGVVIEGAVMKAA